MLASQLFLDPTTDFIARSPNRVEGERPPRPAGAADAPLPTAVAEPMAATTTGFATAGFVERPVWESPIGASVRAVEMAVIGGICAFFAFGLGSTIGIF